MICLDTRTKLDTKTLSLIIVFAAGTIALSLSGIAIPAFYATYLFYQIWEIPIVAAYVLINKKAAIFISVLNAVILVSFFPGVSLLGPVYNLIAILSTLLGIFVVQKFIRINNSSKNTKENGYTKSRFVAYSTILGILLRVGIMSIVNYVVLRYPYPIGFELDEVAILTIYLPATAIFNATVVLYTIPIGLFIGKAISKNLKL